MRRAFWILAAVAMTGAAGGAAEEAAASVVLPSGLEAALQERRDEAEGVYRFRYVAPEFDRDIGLEVITQDLAHLCATQALPELTEGGAEVAQIVISLSDKPSQFGVYDPDVAQVFEAYRVEDGLCIWEAF